MRSILFSLAGAVALWAAVVISGSLQASDVIPLHDGKTFRGWDGDTNVTWRIEDGAFVGGYLDRRIPHNEFLATTQSFTNFVLRLKFKLTGTEGFINSGVQIRSERLENPAHEMIGYQADIGDGWWGALYDESRRNKVLVKPDDETVERAVRRGEWNDYKIHCEGRRIRTWINDVPMIDYTESDESLPQHGRIGLQIHGGAKAEVRFKEITIEILP